MDSSDNNTVIKIQKKKTIIMEENKMQIKDVEHNEWAKNLNRRTLLNIYLLFNLLMSRFNFRCEGNRGIANDVKVYFSEEEIADFEKWFPFERGPNKIKKGKKSGFPFQKGEFPCKTWSIDSYPQLKRFFSLFQDIRPKVEMIYGVDFEMDSFTKEVSRKDYWKMLRNEEEMKNFQESFPSKHCYFIRAKIAIGQGCNLRNHKFVISYTSFPGIITGGYMSFQFCYEKRKKGYPMGRKLLYNKPNEIQFHHPKNTKRDLENDDSSIDIFELSRKTTEKICYYYFSSEDEEN